MVMTKKAFVLGFFVSLVGWSEIVHWRASRAGLPASRAEVRASGAGLPASQAGVRASRAARSEAVVVLGYRNKRGDRANALNRWRVRAALRSMDRTVSRSVLVCSGGVTSRTSSVSEAALLARYAVSELGFAGTVQVEEQSRSTWENVRNVIPLVEDLDQVKIVSNPLHAQKARLYLGYLRPDLAGRLVRAADYRVGEAWAVKPLFALYGLRGLARARRSLAARDGG